MTQILITAFIVIALNWQLSAVSTAPRTARSPFPITKPIVPEDLIASQATGVVFAKLKNVSRLRLDVYAQGGQGGDGDMAKMKLIGSLASGDSTSMALHENQRIHYTLAGTPEKIESSFTLSADQCLYPLGLATTPDPELLQEIEQEKAFSLQYQLKHKRPWRHYYGFYVPHLGPRGNPSKYLKSKHWPADFEGQTHTINDKLTLECICTTPKIFVVRDFLAHQECDELIALAKSVGNLQDSVVGSKAMGIVTDKVQRSSSTAWLTPNSAPLINSIYERAAIVLEVEPSDMLKWTESMQVVHYKLNQHYSAHYDFEVTSKAPQSRYATLLLYLNDQESELAGGETAFPVAKMKNSDDGLKVHPGKGSAVLFYNLLEDGNGDELSLHSALPVKVGEKWAANLWLWS